MATNANSEYNKQDTKTDDIPQGGDTVDNSYATRLIKDKIGPDALVGWNSST
jgi:hypothetical protein